ncbi:helix-turn-helix domain-containing protein [Escherichia coli O120:H1]|uniref:helix-turn-helix domain-containing protein n=1 Tax=Escherichia coli TaxID=562 RepID=UPI0019BAE514|nr:helix-turn-helix domain-containing protein [Escherichia coli]CAD5780864.1 putative signal transduction protein [Escherichia coli]CAD5794200.1 putative signal transduction protein [Escherichia coli]
MARFITVLLPEYNIEVNLLIKINLTVTEMLLLEFLLQGKDVSEIAACRQKSPKTISSQKLQLYKKLGVKNDIVFWREVVLRYKPMINYLQNVK